jgi:hypothetical protein
MDDADKRAQKSTIFATGVKDPQLQSKPKGPTRKFFAALRSIEMMDDYGDAAVDVGNTLRFSTIRRHPARQIGRLPLYLPLK